MFRGRNQVLGWSSLWGGEVRTMPHLRRSGEGVMDDVTFWVAVASAILGTVALVVNVVGARNW